MSFSSELKDELARVQVQEMDAMISELAGFIRMCGRINITGNGNLSISFITEHAATSRRIFSFLRTLYQEDISVEVRRSDQRKKKNSYQVHLREDGACRLLLDDVKFLKNENVFMPRYSIDPYLIRRRDLARALVRGAFLGAGTISNPKKTYHLEFVTSQASFAKSLQGILGNLGVKAGLTARKEDFVVYLKEGEMISDLLSMMGSNQGVLAFEDVRVMKDMRNQVNRLVNCETANLSKTINAGLRQIEDIKWIDKVLGLQELPDSLQEMARVRLLNPSASLKELGELMNPKVGKSGVNHRLKKIQEIAENLRGESK